MQTDTMGEDYSRSIANEALAKMMAIEKCDITIINPLCKSDQSFRSTYQPKVSYLWKVLYTEFTHKYTILIVESIIYESNSVYPVVKL